MSAALDPVLLADDLQLLWYDPIDGSPALRSGQTGVGSLERIHTLGAAVLVDLLLHGGAELVPDKSSRLRLEAQARGLAAPSALVAASASAPLLRELEPDPAAQPSTTPCSRERVRRADSTRGR